MSTDQANTNAADVGNASGAVPVQVPEFPPLQATATAGPPAELNRFSEVQVTVSAELGRTKLPIQKLLQMGVGSVVELNRPISSPVNLVAQGVPLACGEVVVVDGCFAIRIKEIFSGDVNRVSGDS